MSGYQEQAKIGCVKYLSRSLRLLDNMWVQLKFYNCDCIVFSTYIVSDCFSIEFAYVLKTVSLLYIWVVYLSKLAQAAALQFHIRKTAAANGYCYYRDGFYRRSFRLLYSHRQQHEQFRGLDCIRCLRFRFAASTWLHSPGRAELVPLLLHLVTPNFIDLNSQKSMTLSVCLFVCLSVCLFVCLSVCLYVCLFVCLFVWLASCLFADRCFDCI